MTREGAKSSRDLFQKGPARNLIPGICSKNKYSYAHVHTTPVIRFVGGERKETKKN